MIAECTFTSCFLSSDGMMNSKEFVLVYFTLVGIGKYKIYDMNMINILFIHFNVFYVNGKQFTM